MGAVGGAGAGARGKDFALLHITSPAMDPTNFGNKERCPRPPCNIIEKLHFNCISKCMDLCQIIGNPIKISIQYKGVK